MEEPGPAQGKITQFADRARPNLENWNQGAVISDVQ